MRDPVPRPSPRRARPPFLFLVPTSNFTSSSLRRQTFRAPMSRLKLGTSSSVEFLVCEVKAIQGLWLLR